MFGASVSYVLMLLSHIILRRKDPNMERPYVTPGGTLTSGIGLVLAELGQHLGPEELGGLLAAEADEVPREQLLAGGIVLVVVYAFVVDFLGFLLSTFLFLAAFMYLGRYRKHKAVWAVSGGVTLAAALIFMRFAYVSLPRGVPPFDAVTDFVRVMLGG